MFCIIDWFGRFIRFTVFHWLFPLYCLAAFCCIDMASDVVALDSVNP